MIRPISKADWKAKASWLHSLRSCCLSGRSDGIELSHLHEGSFKLGRKVSGVLVLPMHHILHKAQHKHPDFWNKALPGHDPKHWAVRLDDIYQVRDLEAADALLRDMQDQANRDYLATFLALAGLTMARR